jgi:hypothetical protein
MLDLVGRPVEEHLGIHAHAGDEAGVLVAVVVQLVVGIALVVLGETTQRLVNVLFLHLLPGRKGSLVSGKNKYA